MIDLAWTDLLDRLAQALGREQIACHQLELSAQMLRAAQGALRRRRGSGHRRGGDGRRRRAAHQAGDAIPVLEQQLRQERSILAGDAGDQSVTVWCVHARSLRFMSTLKRVERKIKRFKICS